MVSCFVPILLLTLTGFADLPKPLPVSAHNCYPHNSQSNSILVEALKLGIDNIEIDLGWDASGNRLIVGHDAEPKLGILYPEFEGYLVPALEDHWRTHQSDGTPNVLTIDWKTDHPDAIRRFKELLDARPDWFSSAPKADPSPMTRRKLTVCFTGDDQAKRLYDKLIPQGGTYRAFRDRDYAPWELFRKNINNYAQEPASAYNRFLSVFWGHVWSQNILGLEVGIPPGLDSKWSKEKEARLKALVARAHKQGYQIRFYTLNGEHGGIFDCFLSMPTTVHRWRATVEAGADWVATDEYKEFVRQLGNPLPVK